MSDFRLKCTKFDFGWGSAPDPAGGAYSAPPDPLAGFKGPTSKGRGGDGRGGERKGEGRGGKEGKGGGRGPISSAGPGSPKHVKTALAGATHFDG